MWLVAARPCPGSGTGRWRRSAGSSTGTAQHRSANRHGNWAVRSMRACTHLALRVVDVVRAVAGAPDNTAQSRGAHVRSCGSHGTPAAVPCACVGSAARARARSIARRLRQHAARGQAHQRPAARRVCMHVAGSQGRGRRAGCSLSIATRLLGGAVDDHARSIDRLEGLEVADERKHLCRAPLLELKRVASFAFFREKFLRE